jgi:hypothetical protein
VSTRALVLDVDGVVSPLCGHTAFGDDVVAGHVFTPVLVSPTMCTRLDELEQTPGVSCWWLTSWTAEMRAHMDPFPGRGWPSIGEPPHRIGRRWWKLDALTSWLQRHPEIRSIAWCDDRLRPPARSAAARRELRQLDVEAMLLAPDSTTGLTPEALTQLTTWANPGRSGEPRTHAPSEPEPDPETPALGPGSGGRWLIITRRTTHVLDLANGTYERRPGSTSQAFPFDNRPVPYSRITVWPRIGGQLVLWFDDPDHPTLLEHYRISSDISAIVEDTPS